MDDDRPDDLELRADDDRIREILGEPDGLIVSWMIVARTAHSDRTGGVIICTDDDCDTITHMGLSAAAMADANQKLTELSSGVEFDDDEDDE